MKLQLFMYLLTGKDGRKEINEVSELSLYEYSHREFKLA